MNFNDVDLETMNITNSTFNFSGVRPENLEETEYTLVNLLIDVSGSVSPFSTELDQMVKEVVGACQKSPKAENILLRLVHFSSDVNEVHGYIDIPSIDINNYESIRCGGMTALIDATYTAVGSIIDYAKSLDNQDIMCNGITFIVTDGMDNASSYSKEMLKIKINSLIKEEILDSNVTILIGVNTTDSIVKNYLDSFKDEVKIDQYVDMGEVSASKLAKLGGFISKSISSQSQSLGTGQAVSTVLNF